MLIKDLPEEIKKLYYKRYEEYCTFKYIIGPCNENMNVSYYFPWYLTPEKFKFWESINKGNFKPFYDRYPKKEFILPEKWCVKSVNVTQDRVITNWFNKLVLPKVIDYSDDWVGYYHYDSKKPNEWPCNIKRNNNYEFLTFEQFQKYVLKQETIKIMEKGQIVTRTQLKCIWDIACARWKEKIESIVDEQLGCFNDFYELSDKLILEMFKAADQEQKVVLEGIFKYPIEDKNAFIDKFTKSEETASFSRKYFGKDYAFQVAMHSVPRGRSDLSGRSFLVSDDFTIVLHKINVGTVIEIVKR